MKILITIISLLLFTKNVFGQIIFEQTKSSFYYNGVLSGKKTEYKYYNSLEKLTKEVSLNFEGNPYILISEYYYDPNNRLIKEVYSAKNSYYDTHKNLNWGDTNKIYSKVYEYNNAGLLGIEKKFSFSCNFEKADVSEYFYANKKLIRKYCFTECSQGPRSHMYPFNFPIYYFYDINDSLICEKAMRARDTTKIWYMKKYDYQTIPNGKICEYYYEKGDSIKLETYDLSQDYFDDKGQITMTALKYEVSRDYHTISKYNIIYKYNKRQKLIEEYSKNDKSETLSKTVYRYYKNGRKRMVKEYEWNNQNKRKLKSQTKYKYVFGPLSPQ